MRDVQISWDRMPGCPLKRSKKEKGQDKIARSQFFSITLAKSEGGDVVMPLTSDRNVKKQILLYITRPELCGDSCQNS